MNEEAVIKLNSGPEDPADEDNDDYAFHIKTALEEESIKLEDLKTEAERNCQKTGSDLKKWATELVNEFYSVRSICYIKTDEKLLSNDIKNCVNQSWSSLYPDPKSTITEVNEETGKLI